LAEEYIPLSPAGKKAAVAKFDKKLVTILAKYGIIADAQKDDIVAAAEKENLSLTEFLVNKKMTTEADVIGAVSEEMNLPPIDIERIEIDKEALDLVPEDIAKQYQVFPIAKIGKTLTMAVANPMDVMTQDDVKIVTGCELIPVVSSDIAIRKAIEKAYKSDEGQMEDLVATMGMDELIELAEEGGEDGDSAADTEQSESAPVVKLVNLIVYEAVKAGASDIHIEPYEKKVRVRYRIDGSCSEKLSPPRKLHNAVTSRIKIMANLDIAERRKPQDGKFRMKFSNKEVDFRVSTLPLVHGEKIVMRILDTSGLTRDLDGLGFEAKAMKDFTAAIASAYGMVLVTGPTGSGKSTTLYSAIRKIISPADNITTVEDPVEYTMEGVNQVQVNEKAGLGFSEALRSILRQDPDTVLIGEMRDKETAEIAVKAALTGHLVFSTLHTNDAPTTITRLIDMGVDKFLVSSCVILVTAQRLVRRLCKECAKTYVPTEEQMREWEFTEQEFGAKAKLLEAGGCQRCNGNGYKGRLPLLETMPMNEALREAIVRGGSAVDVKRVSLEQGMQTLRRVGILNALRGTTSIQEVLNMTMSDK
jgi:type IV pilus assembly protein PilB